MHFSLVGTKKMLADSNPAVITGYLEYPGCLLAVDTDHTELGILLIPFRWNRVKDQAKIALLAGLDRSRRDRLYVDVGLAGADQTERYRQPLSVLPDVAMEANLNRNRVDRSITGIRDLAVDIGDLGPGKAIGFAHLEVAEGQAGSIGVGGSHTGAPGWGVRVDTVAYHEPGANAYNDRYRSDDPRQP